MKYYSKLDTHIYMRNQRTCRYRYSAWSIYGLIRRAGLAIASACTRSIVSIRQVRGETNSNRWIVTSIILASIADLEHLLQHLVIQVFQLDHLPAASSSSSSLLLL